MSIARHPEWKLVETNEITRRHYPGHDEIVTEVHVRVTDTTTVDEVIHSGYLEDCVEGVITRRPYMEDKFNNVWIFTVYTSREF